ncbi:MAG: CPBP family intramembrane glutamic endopeptidase [Chloroflexota bacterium]
MSPILLPRTKANFFFLFAFIWSFFFWTLTILLGGISQFPGSILQYFGGAGPFVAALVITHFFEDRPLQRCFWSRTFDFRRIPPRWFIPALLLHPTIILFAVLFDLGTGGSLQGKGPSLNEPWSLVSLVFFVFVFGPLPEEMGWRGVAYDRLTAKMNALQASLWLGVAWAAWHIPLFFIEGTFHASLGFGSPRFWIFLLSNIPLTVIMTWIYNHTERSTLAAVLVHFSGNMVGALIIKSPQLAFYELLGLLLVALLLTVRTGPSLKNSRVTEVA